MQNSVHGHTVINLVKAQPGHFTPDSLRETVKKEHGDALFHTCSLQGMTLDKLVDFLISKKKLLLEDGKLVPNEARICNHD